MTTNSEGHTEGPYSASSANDLSRLSVALTAMPKWLVLAHVHDLGLMRCRQQPLALMMGAVKRLRGTAGLMNFFLHLKARQPDVLNMWWADTLHHMHFGKDTEDADSIGGWSQREIDLLVSRIPSLATGASDARG